MNVRLLRKVQRAIVANPEEYDQSSYCGTACCIAGWAVRLNDKISSLNGRWPGEVSAEAKSLLKLDTDQYERLCAFASGWPDKYAVAYYSAETKKKRARVAFLRINHFIKTKGAE